MAVRTIPTPPTDEPGDDRKNIFGGVKFSGGVESDPANSSASEPAGVTASVPAPDLNERAAGMRRFAESLHIRFEDLSDEELNTAADRVYEALYEENPVAIHEALTVLLLILYGQGMLDAKSAIE